MSLMGVGADPRPLGKMLMAADALAQSAVSKCATPGIETQGGTNVLVSTCLSATSKAEIASWDSRLDDQNQLYFDGSSAYAIKYVVKFVVGKTKGGTEYAAKASELTFTYVDKATSLPTNTIVAIFFAGDEAAKDKMEDIPEKDLNVRYCFHLCESATPTCTEDGKWKKHHTVESPNDLVKFSPFSLRNILLPSRRRSRLSQKT